MIIQMLFKTKIKARFSLEKYKTINLIKILPKNMIFGAKNIIFKGGLR